MSELARELTPLEMQKVLEQTARRLKIPVDAVKIRMMRIADEHQEAELDARMTWIMGDFAEKLLDKADKEDTK